MRVLSEMDRFHLAQDAANAVYGEEASAFSQRMTETVDFHHKFICENGEDIPEVMEWKWEALEGAAAAKELIANKAD